MTGRKLDESDYFVDAEVERAESLPASAFTTEEFLQLELRTVFSRTWLLVPDQQGRDSGSVSDFLRVPGSRVPVSMLGKPVFVQRGRSGVLNCFPNVCTHAWHTLVESPNLGGTIVCPQHGRRFDDEGRFLSQTGFEKMENFPRSSDHLAKLQTGEMEPFFFVCFEHPLAPLQNFVGELQRSSPGIDLKRLKRHRVGKEEVREVEGNWKQHAWNYMDNYHIRFVHKGPEGLASAIDLSSYKTELYKWSALQWAYARNSENGFDPALLSSRFQDPKRPERRVFALWWFIFPNLTFNFYPWGLSVNVYVPVLGRPNKTLFLWYEYALDEEKFQRRNETWLNEQIDAEDVEAIREVMKGAMSGYAPRGRFAPGEEAGPHWFHRLVFETVLEKHTPR